MMCFHRCISAPESVECESNKIVLSSVQMNAIKDGNQCTYRI